MRQLRYSVAASLDGYIAGPNGEFDWIPMDPDIDFAAMHAGYSAIVMGRKSHEVAGGDAAPPGLTLPTYVCSRTQPEGERQGVTFVRDAVALVTRLKQDDGKPIWLWGGGELFRELAGQVDGVDVAIIPILLGGGRPLLAPPAPRLSLTLRAHRIYPKTGIAFLEYEKVKGPRVKGKG
jgi:dihydrofolate reductase